MSIAEGTLIAIRDIPMTAILEAESIPYKKIGREAVTVCPWHSDTNPSLTLNDDKSMCFCFVCRGGSDSIDYIQQKFGLSFSEAVERIASRHNLAVEYDNIDPELAAAEAKKRRDILDELNATQDKFRGYLKDPRADRIRGVLFDREITPATSRHFGLGYSPSGFFADRITVPIHDHRGTLVGFTGRSTSSELKPKYKNSENSEIFDKSKIVFNEHGALEPIREADSVIFVEGHFDVIALWQHGIRNVVAMQGTGSPSEAIIRRLSRRTKRFILCYDGDDGGRKATEQFLKIAGPMACRGELTISIVALPPGKDPEDCIRDEEIDLYNLIENAPTWLDWQLDCWLNNVDRSDTARFSQVETTVRNFVESIQSPALRQYYIDKASKSLAADEKMAAKIAKDWAGNISPVKSKRKWRKPAPQDTRNAVERRLLRLYIHFPELRGECVSMMEDLQSPAHRWLWKRLLEIEEHFGESFSPQVVMAILAVCEPHYTRQLRALAVPTVKLKNNPGILNHIQSIMATKLVIQNGAS
jgi:DNA primase